MGIQERFGQLATLKVRGRMFAGFAAVCVILAAAVFTTIYQVSTVGGGTDRIVELRVPTAAASAKMVNNINASLASLRGWMLTGNVAFKTERAAVWADIATVRARIDELSASWTNPDNVRKWQEFGATLDEFSTAQDQVEAIANSPQEQPATVILLEQAAPRAKVVVKEITAMIDEEQGLSATAERKALLGMMADVRGTMGLSLANIRAFLLTGQDKFAKNFAGLWAKNERRFADLAGQSHLFTASQRASFEALSEARTAFAPLSPKMFEIRGSKKWNMANYTLITAAAPRAGKLLTTLAGPKAADGSRSGGMVDNQRALLGNDAEEVRGDITALNILEWILLAIGLAVAGAIAFLTARSIVDPVREMTTAMMKLAEGDTSVEVPALHKTDEIGEMAQSVQIFKENRIKADEMAAHQKQEQAEKEQRAERVTKLTADFDGSVGEILKTVTGATEEMERTAQSMTKTAEETASKAGAVAAASEQATSNVQTVASAAEEMASSISEISRQVSDSAQIAAGATEEAERTNSTVNNLGAAAQKIGEVVNLINDIASQTNLLALNATIEAARAGEAGKGFAVVASEVKNLADQTAKATEDIAAQVSSMQEETTGAIQAIGGIGETIAKINDIASGIASAVEEQGAVTQEISRNVQEAAVGTQEVSQNIVAVNQAASETGASSGEVLTSSQGVGKQTQVLNDVVEKFLSDIRAA